MTHTRNAIHDDFAVYTWSFVSYIFIS